MKYFKLACSFTKDEFYPNCLVCLSLKHLDLVCHSTEYLKLKRIDRRQFTFFVKKVNDFLNDFWNFQILSPPSVKTTFIADFFVVIFVSATFLGLFVFSSDAEAYSEPFQTYFKHKMKVFTKIAIDYFDKKLHLWCLIRGVSTFTAPEPHLPHFLHRITTSGPKIRPVLKKFRENVENVKS